MEVGTPRGYQCPVEDTAATVMVVKSSGDHNTQISCRVQKICAPRLLRLPPPNEL